MSTATNADTYASGMCCNNNNTYNNHTNYNASYLINYA